MNPTDPQTKLQMPMSRPFVIAAVVASLALVACGDDDDPTTTTPSAPAAEDQAAHGDAAQGDAAAEEEDEQGSAGDEQRSATGTEIVAAESQYGSILFDSEQQAIYLFDKETSDTSQCYGACAEAWPPVLTKGDPAAGDGVEAKLLGTTERDDGSTQVTYNGHPLYYYVDDPAGEVLCHNVEEFGGLWLVVAPGGDAVQ
jgi:predicted lipoprotein with Yx(FWY)xxD motif